MKIYSKSLLLIFSCCLFLLQYNELMGQINRYIKRDTLQFQHNFISFTHFPYLVDSILTITDISGKNQLYNYIFKPEDQSLIILDSITYSTIIVHYKFIPIKKETFQKNQPTIKRDSSTRKEITVIKKNIPANPVDDIFGRRFERSGTLTRGFTFGTNKDFTLNSGLRLQLSGQLNDDIEVVAALSDQQSPIQPEGNTRTLQEIDKVFIELKHRNFIATFGDFQFTTRNGTFGKLDKKLQGLKSTAIVDEKNNFTISYASSRGKFKSQQFTGIDGVQGPYRLTGENNEREIIVLAGTEKVFINGEEKIRGENYDYIIDYATGEIIFNPRVVITSASRIRVDFEYSDRKFERNFFGTSMNTSFLNEKMTIGFSYFREGDNQNQPIDYLFTEEDKKILRESGNNRLLASKNGVKFVGYDSTGKPAGTYRLRDTLINGESLIFYEFAPGDDSAFYNISFSFVGEGKGDYIRVGLGRFKFVGPSKGNYQPIILLPLPELKQIGNLYSRIFLTKNLFLESEIAFSSFDKNRFSPIDDDKNKGKAYSYKIGIDSTKLKLSRLIDGIISISYYERKTDANFSSMSRIYEVEYERNWNLSEASNLFNESIQEIEMKYIQKQTSTQLAYGKLTRGSVFQTNRSRYNLSTQLIKNVVLNYDFSDLKTKSTNYLSNYQKHFFAFDYKSRFFSPFLRFEYENKIDKNNVDSLLSSSFRFYDLTTGASSDYIKYIDLNISFKFREDVLPSSNTLITESNSYIYQLLLKLKNIKDISSILDISFRDKKYSPGFKQLGFTNNQSISIKYIGRGIFFNRFLQGDLYYEATSQRASKLEKIFLRVPKGTGQYIYKGDLNGNGITDDFEFEPTRFEGDYILSTYPTEELFPVIDLKASIRLKLQFKNLQLNNPMKKYLSPLSTETYLRVEENSQDKNESNIYLLRIKTFQNPFTTIRGNNLVQQDIYLFEYEPDFNILLRFREQKSFSKFNITEERRYQKEQIIRLRVKPLKEFANQSEITVGNNNLLSSTYSLRNFRIKSVSLSSKTFYYPFSNVEAGIKFEYGKSEDNFPQIPLISKSNSQELSITINFSRKGKILFSLERTEIILNQELNYIPFELTRGYLSGKNFIWRTTVDYEISSGIQLRAVYDGRVQGKNNPVHSATAEVRAYF